MIRAHSQIDFSIAALWTLILVGGVTCWAYAIYGFWAVNGDWIKKLWSEL